jgi:hypothetical protein
MTRIPGRLPYEPLERLLRAHWDAPTATRGAYGKDHGLWCDTQAATMLGVGRYAIMKYRSRGISPAVADRLACHIGTHPLLVWGAAWEIADIGAELRRAERKVAA